MATVRYPREMQNNFKLKSGRAKGEEETTVIAKLDIGADVGVVSSWLVATPGAKVLLVQPE